MAENGSFDLLDKCYKVDVDYIDQRFWLVTFFGSLISAVSIVENAFLFCVFITSRHHRNSHSLYLLLLAFFDVYMSVSFVTLMSVRVLFNYAESVYLKNLWMSYVVPMMAGSHIAMTTSSFLIVFATVERFAITKASTYVEFLQRNRKWIALLAVLLGVVSKVTIAFEFKVQQDPGCNGTIGEFFLTVTDLVRENRYYLVWRFWYRNLITILLPFFVLMAMNAQIVNELRKQAYDPLVSHFTDHQRQPNHAKQRKARIRSATRTLVLIVVTYLLANVLNVIITIWEHIDAETLLFSYTQFYIISVDAVSLLTIVACALRLPIYWGCQPLLRAEMEAFLKQLMNGHARKVLDRRMTVFDPSSLPSSGALVR
uniref:G_PROTEIN_RECEP_F1_2 domain-containing protein n=1 Tax=Steinernema glaseri TaxID=37863 RepID=A0A1I7YIC6_9BILA